MGHTYDFGARCAGRYEVWRCVDWMCGFCFQMLLFVGKQSACRWYHEELAPGWEDQSAAWWDEQSAAWWDEQSEVWWEPG
jgi:hypothetical protein